MKYLFLFGVAVMASSCMTPGGAILSEGIAQGIDAGVKTAMEQAEAVKAGTSEWDPEAIGTNALWAAGTGIVLNWMRNRARKSRGEQV